ncbi:MAG: response regulator [Planctomycetota bacterium]|nr:response regulator [Planctomycetota bacterium]
MGQTDTVKVLVAEDESSIREIFQALLEERSDCEVVVACDGEEALRKVASYQPDLLITDLKMPRMDGEELSDRAIQIQPDLTILVETGNPSLECAVRLMQRGAVDFISKPFDLDDLERRIEQAFDKSRARRSQRSVQAIVGSLMAALEAKDPYLKSHSERVSRLATQLGRDVGLDALEVERLGWAALVHDVGKIGVSETVLHKPGKLTEEEFTEMKRHPVYSAEIIRPLAHLKGGDPTVRAIYHHHERMDGKGYPDGIKGEAIPLLSRLISVCDVFDALSSDRPYRKALGEEKIREIIEDLSGDHLDEQLAAVFLRNLNRYRSDVVY